jgi:hypothetical protein
MHVGAHKEVTEADVAALAAEEQVKGMVTGADVAMPAAEDKVTVTVAAVALQAPGREAELLATMSSWRSRSSSHQLKTAPRLP